MKATAVSSVNNKICVKIKKFKIIRDAEGPVFPRRVKRRCPAIILADRRIAKVPGRIIFLIISIHTINGIRMAGVPWGIKCLNICSVKFNQPKIINAIHRGRDKFNVITIWLVLVKM